VNALAIDQVSVGDAFTNDETMTADTVSDNDESFPTVTPGDAGSSENESADTESGDTVSGNAGSEDEEFGNAESGVIDSIDVETIVLEPVIISVKVPENLDFKIDPYNIASRGQIYSNGKMIQNRGNTDVRITFTDIEIRFANEEEFEPLTEPFDMPFEEALKYERKAIYITLDFGRPDVEPVVITGWDGEQPTVLLTTEETDINNSFVNLTVGGNLNPGPLNYWKDGDVSISIDYRIEAVYPDPPTDDPLETISTSAEPSAEATQVADEGD
jgi:hypothetical protein